MAIILDMPLEEDLSLTTGTGPATFTRSTTATYVDKDDGLVKTAAIDTARFETNGVLIEGASTNEALHNRDFTDVVWSKSSITAAKDATGLDGVASSASTLTATAINGTAFQTITRASAENTYSIDIRRKTGTGIIDISDDGGSTYTDITSSINGSTYTRVTLTTTQANPGIGIRVRASGDEVEVDFATLEELGFASSRVEVAATPVTRTADRLSIPSSNIPVPASDYSISFDYIVFGQAYSNPYLFRVVSEVNRYALFFADAVKIRLAHTSTNDVDVPGLQIGQTYSYTATKDASETIQYIDGVVGTPEAPGTVTGTKTAITIGNNNGSASSYIFGHIKNLKIYDVAIVPVFIPRIMNSYRHRRI